MAKKKNNKYSVDGYELQLGTGHTFEFIPEFDYKTRRRTDKVDNTRVVPESVKLVKEKKARKSETAEHALVDNSKEELKQMSYYLSEDLVKAIALKSAYFGVNKSQVVRDALSAFLVNELTKLKKR